MVLGGFKSSQGWMGVAEGIQGHAELSPASPWKELTVVTWGISQNKVNLGAVEGLAQ